ncbi:MAG: hypothetical protein JNL51_08905 [Chitinophagaceae bacterium]|nr:hypothetical protein [Chitinophagaceae bacterium]
MMAAKKTIAIVGATDLLNTALERKLAQANCRALLVSEDETQFADLLKSVSGNTPGAEIEAQHCIRESCWEADIIILGINEGLIEETIKKIKEVATQKIVVCLTRHEGAITYQPGIARALQCSLPYSKAVYIFNAAATGDLLVAGNDEEAVETVINLADKGGIRLQKAGSLSALPDKQNLFFT